MHVNNMTAMPLQGGSRQPPGPPPNSVARRYVEHSSAERVNTHVVMVDAIRAEYPNMHITVTPRAYADLLSFASAGHAELSPLDSESDRLTWREYLPPPSRLTGSHGVIATQIQFAKYLLSYRSREYILYVVDGRDGTQSYPVIVNQYIISTSTTATNDLILAAGAYGAELHNEVWVFDGGRWQKSAELWDSVQKASWEDVILDENMKANVREDVDKFFDSRATYEKLRVPWKRGLIFWGPPGNGKTISIKAMMKSLYGREEAVPTLYVRTLASFAGPEYSLQQIFGLARRTAPCLLVFEDLDSIVSDNVRSYFLNEVDGIRKNDGILMIGSTNHLERLDPGISKRPSRFDRKYLFPNPNEEERTKYMQYWQTKLSDNKEIDFPDKLCPAIARITDGFSFAYLQEAMVATLLAIARKDKSKVVDLKNEADAARMTAICRKDKSVALDKEDKDLDNYEIWREIKKQIRILRDEIGEGEGALRKP